MTSANMTVAFTVARPFPNFVIGAGPFFLGCLRSRISAAATSRAWHCLFIALRLGCRIWYYCSMPGHELKTEGDYWIVRRVLAPKSD